MSETPAGEVSANGGAHWEHRVLTAVCALVTALVVWPHLRGAPAAIDDAALHQYSLKYQLLRESELGTRYFLASLSSGNYRRLDQMVAPEAKIFASGLIGPTNGSRLGNFYFAIYHLFPRQIHASLGEPARFTGNGWIEGVDCQNDDVLRALGYNLRLAYEVSQSDNEKVMIVPLSGRATMRPGPLPIAPSR